MADAPDTSSYLLVSPDQIDLPNSRLLTNSETVQIVDGGIGADVTIYLTGNLYGFANVTSLGYFTRIGSNQATTTSFTSTDGSITVTNPAGQAGDTSFALVDNKTVQNIYASANGGNAEIVRSLKFAATAPMSVSAIPSGDNIALNISGPGGGTIPVLDNTFVTMNDQSAELPQSFSLGSLDTGLILNTVSMGVSTLTKATEGTDYPSLDATYVLNSDADGQTNNGQILTDLTDGLAKVTTGTGVISIAVAGTDYQNPTILIQSFGELELDTGDLIVGDTITSFSVLKAGNEGQVLYTADGINLAWGDVGAPSAGHYLTLDDETSLYPDSFSLGSLTTGLLLNTVNAGKSTLTTAVLNTDYVNRSPYYVLNTPDPALTNGFALNTLSAGGIIKNNPSGPSVVLATEGSDYFDPNSIFQSINTESSETIKALLYGYVDSGNKVGLLPIGPNGSFLGTDGSGNLDFVTHTNDPLILWSNAPNVPIGMTSLFDLNLTENTFLLNTVSGGVASFSSATSLVDYVPSDLEFTFVNTPTNPPTYSNSQVLSTSIANNSILAWDATGGDFVAGVVMAPDPFMEDLAALTPSNNRLLTMTTGPDSPALITVPIATSYLGFKAGSAQIWGEFNDNDCIVEVNSVLASVAYSGTTVDISAFPNVICVIASTSGDGSGPQLGDFSYGYANLQTTVNPNDTLELGIIYASTGSSTNGYMNYMLIDNTAPALPSPDP